ncbi:hypothetical protein [Bradyrhizobium sp. 177]|nr:hypothetical protein [Bradyrhizobium sp. 177]
MPSTRSSNAVVRTERHLVDATFDSFYFEAVPMISQVQAGARASFAPR